jgi:hypothetical protein
MGPIGASARSCATRAADAEGMRATGVPCSRARQVLHTWQHQPGCELPGGASRDSCLARSYRCQSVRTDRGLAVSCSREDQSVAFIAKP